MAPPDARRLTAGFALAGVLAMVPAWRNATVGYRNRQDALARTGHALGSVPGLESARDYTWTDEQTIIGLRAVGASEPRRASATAQTAFQAFAWNRAHSAEKVLGSPIVLAAPNLKRRSGDLGWSTATTSPHGRWAVVANGSSEQGLQHLSFMDLGHPGARPTALHVPAHVDGPMLWTPEKDRLVLLSHTRDSDAARVDVTMVDLGAGRCRHGTVPAAFWHRSPPAFAIVAMRDEHTLLTAATEADSSVRVESHDVGNPALDSAELVEMPEDDQRLIGLAISPDGTHALIVLAPSGTDASNGLPTSHMVVPVRHCTIWSCDVGRLADHRLAYVPVSGGIPGNPAGVPHNLKWLPNGKTAGFELNHRLYTLQVP